MRTVSCSIWAKQAKRARICLLKPVFIIIIQLIIIIVIFLTEIVHSNELSGRKHQLVVANKLINYSDKFKSSPTILANNNSNKTTRPKRRRKTKILEDVGPKRRNQVKRETSKSTFSLVTNDNDKFETFAALESIRPTASSLVAKTAQESKQQQQSIVEEEARNNSTATLETVAIEELLDTHNLNGNSSTSMSADLLAPPAGSAVLELNALQAANLGFWRHSASASVILTIAYTIVFIVGIVGNSFVVAIVCKSPRMRTVTNYFIANLAFADILVLLFCLPATLMANLFVPYVLGLFVCKTVSYLQGVAVSASINTMVAVTMDRFLAICFPMDWHMSRRNARWTIACIWLFSLTISMPWAVYFTLVPVEFSGKNIHVCAEDWPSERMGKYYFVCANLILCYLFPATVIILCYLGIWYKIERRNIPGDRPKGLKIELIMQKSKLKVVKMMMIVVVIFLLSWLPLYLIFARVKLAEERAEWEEKLIPWLMPLAQWLGASNSCINPILYTFFNRKYKRGFIDLLRFGFCCGPPSSNQGATVGGGTAGVDGAQVAIANAMRANKHNRHNNNNNHRPGGGVSNGLAIKMNTFEANNKSYQVNNRKNSSNNNNNNNKIHLLNNENDTLTTTNNNGGDSSLCCHSIGQQHQPYQKLLENSGFVSGETQSPGTTEVTIDTSLPVANTNSNLGSSKVLNQPPPTTTTTTTNTTTVDFPSSSLNGANRTARRQSSGARVPVASEGGKVMRELDSSTGRHLQRGGQRRRRRGRRQQRRHLQRLDATNETRPVGLSTCIGEGGERKILPKAEVDAQTSAAGTGGGVFQGLKGRSSVDGGGGGEVSLQQQQRQLKKSGRSQRKGFYEQRNHHHEVEKRRLKERKRSVVNNNINSSTDDKLNRPSFNNEPCQLSGAAETTLSDGLIKTNAESGDEDSCRQSGRQSQFATAATGTSKRRQKGKKKRALSRSTGGRSLKSNSTNTTRDTVSTDITAVSLTNGTNNSTGQELRGSNGSLVADLLQQQQPLTSHQTPLDHQIPAQLPVRTPSTQRQLQQRSSTSLSSQYYDDYDDDDDDDDDVDMEEELGDLDDEEYADEEYDEEYDLEDEISYGSGGSSDDDEQDDDEDDDEDDDLDEEEEEDVEDESDDNLLFGSTNNSPDDEDDNVDGCCERNGGDNVRSSELGKSSPTADNIRRSLVASGSSLVNVVIHKLNSCSSQKSWCQMARSELISIPDVDHQQQQRQQHKQHNLTTTKFNREKLNPVNNNSISDNRKVTTTSGGQLVGQSVIDNNNNTENTSKIVSNNNNNHHHHHHRTVSIAGISYNGDCSAGGSIQQEQQQICQTSSNGTGIISSSGINQLQNQVSEFIDSSTTPTTTIAARNSGEGDELEEPTNVSNAKQSNNSTNENHKSGFHLPEQSHALKSVQMYSSGNHRDDDDDDCTTNSMSGIKLPKADKKKYNQLEALHLPATTTIIQPLPKQQQPLKQSGIVIHSNPISH